MRVQMSRPMDMGPRVWRVRKVPVVERTVVELPALEAPELMTKADIEALRLEGAEVKWWRYAVELE